MKLFNFKKKKEENKVMEDANEIVKQAILDKALQENQGKEEQIKNLETKNRYLANKNRKLQKDIEIMLNNAKKSRAQIDNLERNIEVLNNTIEKIEEICNNTNAKVVSKSKILKELGE